MPISPIVLQRRHAELGRIRLGHKTGDKGRPAKLGAFRFTSVSERYIRDLAELYGGAPQPWDNNGVASFEVYSEATTIPVIAVKGGMSQWLETWSGGGCIHRCDGHHNTLTDAPCDPEDRAHQQAKPTTRLSLMLPELEAIGVFRMETHGWNAAAEIPAVAELAQFVGDLVPATLRLDERRSIKDGQTSRFVVPVLDLQIGTAKLREIVAAKSGGGELPSSERPALNAAPTSDPYAAYFDRLEQATSVDECQILWSEMVAAKLVGSHAAENPQANPARASEFIEAFKARGKALAASTSGPSSTSPAVSGQPDEEGIVDAELVPDAAPDPAGEDPDAVWPQVVAAAGQHGMTSADLEQDFLARTGVSSSEASAGEMRRYIDLLSTGEVGAA